MIIYLCFGYCLFADTKRPQQISYMIEQHVQIIKLYYQINIDIQFYFNTRIKLQVCLIWIVITAIVKTGWNYYIALLLGVIVWLS